MIAKRKSASLLVDDDVFGLAEAVDAILGLQLKLRVPVAVHEKQMICACQVQSDASSRQAQQHDTNAGIRLVQFLKKERVECDFD